jgi:hypothetical protein
MRRKLLLRVLWSGSLALSGALGCGPAEERSGTAPPGESTWEELIAGDWELAPGTETYLCARITLDQDLIIGGFEPISPRGTHHTTLSVGPPVDPDGLTPCDGFARAQNGRGLWGSGVGTPGYAFPDEVGMVLRAGEQLLLNLHLFNTSDGPISGRSGLSVLRRDPSRVTHRADGTLMGPIAITLPSMKKTTVTGGCTFSRAGSLFAFMPHMHRLGRHFRAVAERKGHPDEVIHDGAFDFEEQLNRGIAPVVFSAGDRLRVECTYDNDTDEEVSFGESTTDEMCFLAAARYPGTGEIVCTE